MRPAVAQQAQQRQEQEQLKAITIMEPCDEGNEDVDDDNETRQVGHGSLWRWSFPTPQSQAVSPPFFWCSETVNRKQYP